MSDPEPCEVLSKLTKEHMKDCMLCKGNMVRIIKNFESGLRDLE